MEDDLPELVGLFGGFENFAKIRLRLLCLFRLFRLL